MKLRISETLALPGEVATLAQAILAQRGAGKSYTASVFAEELLDAGQQVVAIDPTGAWYGLRSSASGREDGFPIVVFGGDHGDVRLEPTAGETIAAALVQQRFSAVIDLSTFRKGETIQFMTAFLETLYRLNRDPMHLIIDEADVVAPQKVRPEQARLLGAAEDIVRRGRRRGIGCTLITQRPQVLAKDVLTQCEVLTTMRLGHPKDIAAVREWIEVHASEAEADEMMESLPSLPTGTAWVWSPALGIFERTKIRARRTFDSGATPKPGQAAKVPKVLARVDIDRLGAAIAETVQRAKENDPKALRAEVARLRAENEKLLKRPESVKTERVEVAVIDDRHIDRLKGMAEKIDELVARFAAEAKVLREAVAPAMKAKVAPRLAVRVERTPARPKPKAPPTEGSLGAGERAVLTAIAQYDDGVTREQITILTGYKRSTRDTYVQRLGVRGLIVVNGDRVRSTELGIAELGDDFEPLPTGDALREHWIRRLPEGERKILEAVAVAYPDAVDRESIGESTGYKRSTRDTYIQRLGVRRIVTTTRDGVRMSDELAS